MRRITDEMVNGDIHKMADEAGEDFVEIQGKVLAGIMGAYEFLFAKRVELENEIDELKKEKL